MNLESGDFVVLQLLRLWHIGLPGGRGLARALDCSITMTVSSEAHI